jgi:hypothetical protein
MKAHNDVYEGLPYEPLKRQERYVEAGVAEEDIELIFAPFALLNRDPVLRQRAFAAKEKFVNHTREQNKKEESGE